jgi:pimeloyl-ACP methyl ester carboxylesterase
MTLIKSLGRLCILIGAIILVARCGKESSSKTVNSFDGVPISYEVHGGGSPALVFVHGWSCDRTYWKAQVAPFAAKYKVVTIDLAGHGESGKQRSAWTIESFGEDVATVVRELDLEQVIIIGHSMGGDIAVEAARRLPTRVKGFVWVDIYSELGTYRTDEQIEAFIAPFRDSFKERAYELVKGMFPPDADDTLVEYVATNMSSAPKTIALATMKSAITFEPNVTASLLEVNVPGVAITPARVITDTVSMRRYGFSVFPMPGVGHFPMMEKPEDFNKLLLKAIDKIGGLTH